MSELTTEIRKLRRENKKLLERITTLQGEMAFLVLEKADILKRFDEFKSSADIFGGIFKGMK
jgi:chromosome segregation ATPase